MPLNLLIEISKERDMKLSKSEGFLDSFLIFFVMIDVMIFQHLGMGSKF